MTNLEVWRQDDLVVVAQGEDTMSHSEFERLMRAFHESFEEHDYKIRAVIIADAGPNAAQRSAIAESGWRKGRSRAVVITNRPLVRAIVTGLSWFGIQARSAAPRDSEGSLRSFLELRDADIQQVRAVARGLREKLTCSAPSLEGFLVKQPK